MSSTPSLLPCPFCGGAATAKPIDHVPGWYHFTVLHSGCFYTQAMDQMVLNDGSLEVWNRRTPQPVVREPLTNEQRMEVFIEAGKRCDENPNLAWRVAILEQVEIAHGITQKGGSNAE